MPAIPLPHLRNGASQVLHPVTKSVQYQTRVQRFITQREQRCALSWPRISISCPMRVLSNTDRNALLTLFRTALGRVATTLSVSFGRDTFQGSGDDVFTNLALVSDTFSSTEEADQPNQYTVTISVITTKAVAPTQLDPSGTNTYPLLSSGATTQLPYTAGYRFRNDVSQTPYGNQYSYSWMGNGSLPTPKFNTGGDLSGPYNLHHENVTDVELAHIAGFFAYQQGRLGNFNYIDPESGLTVNHCRFNQDELKIQYIQPNTNSFDVSIIQVYG